MVNVYDKQASKLIVQLAHHVLKPAAGYAGAMAILGDVVSILSYESILTHACD